MLPILVACGSAPPAADRARGDQQCQLDTAWVQATLDLWEVSTGKILQRPTTALPYMVYFDRKCSSSSFTGR
jgi:hypothetical protein